MHRARSHAGCPCQTTSARHNLPFGTLCGRTHSGKEPRSAHYTSGRIAARSPCGTLWVRTRSGIKPIWPGTSQELAPTGLSALVPVKSVPTQHLCPSQVSQLRTCARRKCPKQPGASQEPGPPGLAAGVPDIARHTCARHTCPTRSVPGTSHCALRCAAHLSFPVR